MNVTKLLVIGVSFFFIHRNLFHRVSILISHTILGRLYSLQTALTIDKKSDEAKSFLLALMDWLESTKKAASSNESITSEVAAQAYIENYALKLFVWADNMDRSGNFNK